MGPQINALGIVSETGLVHIEEVPIRQSIALLREQSTGGVVWASTPAFVRQSRRPPLAELLCGPVVELGCGTGALARLLPQRSFYLATDQRPLLRLARANCGDHAQVAEFDWERHEFEYEVPAETGAVLAVDTLYNEHLAEPFCEALGSVLKKTGDWPVVLANQVRDPLVLHAALEVLARRFHISVLEPVEEGVVVHVLRLRRPASASA